MSVSILGSFLSETRHYFERLPTQAPLAAMMAVNQVSERQAVPMIRKDIEGQVEFPKGYLNAPDRLGVSKKATRGDLRAIITARGRATSLARFAPAGATPRNTRKGGLTVRVKRGQVTNMPKAFLVSLRSGNTGLAVRLPPGKTMKNTHGAKLVSAWSGSKGNVYLLYGPSVDQVFKTVVVDRIPDIGVALSGEFFRQLARLTRG